VSTSFTVATIPDGIREKFVVVYFKNGRLVKQLRDNQHPMAEALDRLRRLIDWDCATPHPLQIALAYLALAEIRIHRGIQHEWLEQASGPPADYDIETPKPPISKFDHYPDDDDDVREFLDFAIDALGYACEENDPVMAWLHLLPIFDPLREEPGFKKLIERMNLP
jgi:hypothetical protein